MWALLIAVAVGATYANSLGGGFVCDDFVSLRDNPGVHHLRPLGPMLWAPDNTTLSGRPFSALSFGLNYALWGEALGGFHLVNILVHAAAALTLFGLIHRTLTVPSLGRAFERDALPVAGVAALLWAVHPLQTEAVTYVIQRVESLSALFILLTLYAFVRSALEPGPRWAFVSVGACLLGVLSKETAVCAPVLALSYDRIFLAGCWGGLIRRWRLHLALFLTWVVQALLIAGTGWNRGGEVGFGVGVAPWRYWLTQGRAIVWYLRLAFWPHPLSFDYGTVWLGFDQAAPYLLGVAVLGAGVVVLLGVRPRLGFLGLWFFVLLAPSSLPPGTVQMIVEHRVYLALAGVVTAVVLGVHALAGRRGLWALAPLVVVLAAVSAARNRVYDSPLTVYREIVALQPDNLKARSNMGAGLMDAGRYDEADAVFEDLIARGFDPLMMHQNIGLVRLRQRRLDEAAAEFMTVLHNRPMVGDAVFNLAEVRYQQRRYAEAAFLYARARRLGSVTPDGTSRQAQALLITGRASEALPFFREAEEGLPLRAVLESNYGVALMRCGRPGEAVAHFESALRVQPDLAAVRANLERARQMAGGVR